MSHATPLMDTSTTVASRRTSKTGIEPMAGTKPQGFVSSLSVKAHITHLLDPSPLP